MNPRRQKRLMVVSAIVLVVGSAIGLVLYALSQNIDLFYTPSEIIDGKTRPDPSSGSTITHWWHGGAWQR